MVATDGPEVPPTALEVRHASRRLDGRQVLHDVTLDVRRGALVILAGPNGAGKSSLLRAIGGRLALDSGTVAIDGRAATIARRAGRLGVVPQDIALDVHLTVRENLRLWARLAGAPRHDLTARLDAGLAWAGLDDRARSRVDTLSGGMRRRVNLLAGLLHRPALLLLDEPTVGLDREARRQFHALLGDLRRQGVGVLLATHELDEAADTCDVLAVMDAGAVVACDAVAPLLAAYAPSDGEVVVVLDAEPDPATAARLRQDGFVALGGREWACASGPHVDPRGVERRLAGLAMSAEEIRWRRPTVQHAVAAAIARHREAQR